MIGSTRPKTNLFIENQHQIKQVIRGLRQTFSWTYPEKPDHLYGRICDDVFDHIGSGVAVGTLGEEASHVGDVVARRHEELFSSVGLTGLAETDIGH